MVRRLRSLKSWKDRCTVDCLEVVYQNRLSLEWSEKRVSIDGNKGCEVLECALYSAKHFHKDSDPPYFHGSRRFRIGVYPVTLST